MIFKWEICWAAGVSRSRAPLRNATRRGGRTRRATSRRLRMTAASPTPSTRRITTGPPVTRPHRYTDAQLCSMHVKARWGCVGVDMETTLNIAALNIDKAGTQKGNTRRLVEASALLMANSILKKMEIVF